MKRFASLIFAAALLCGCLLIPAQAATDPAGAAGLKFRKDGTFKIIQVSDTQEFLISSTIAAQFLYDLAVSEKPDLFVLMGDNVSTGGASYVPAFLSRVAVRSSVETLMRVFDRIYKDLGIPMTMVYGNHDNEVGPDRVSRAKQFEMYARHKCFIGYYIPEADEGTQDEQGQHYGTHNLLVYDKAGVTPKFNLWLFDSGSYDERGGYSGVQEPQVAWFNETNEALGKLPSIAFQHIIVPEIYDFLTPEKKLPADTIGELREDPCPGQYNYGQYEALNSAGNVLAMFFGHDHVNTFELRRSGTDLVNSPCTSFGSYGDIDLRGVRVITLKDSDLTGYETRCVSYQGYYGDGFLRETRLKMFQSMGTAATLLDVFTFRPLFWLTGLFG